MPGAGGFDNDAHGIGLAGLNYWEFYIANVIGTPGAMSGWVFHNATGANAIWTTGFFDGGDTAVDGEVWSQVFWRLRLRLLDGRSSAR